MFGNCWSWPPVRVSRFRPFLSYMENPWAPGHISKCEGGTGGSIAPFLRGAMLHSMNFKTSKQNFYRKLFLWGPRGHSTAVYNKCTSSCPTSILPHRVCATVYPDYFSRIFVLIFSNLNDRRAPPQSAPSDLHPLISILPRARGGGSPACTLPFGVQWAFHIHVGT